MNENTHSLTEEWKAKLTGKSLDQIDIRMINEHYLEYEEGAVWVADGGFEITSGDEKFSFSFHDDSGNFSMQSIPLQDLLEGFDHYPVSLAESDAALALKGAVISDVIIRWSGYEILDYAGNVAEQADIPTEFILELDNGKVIQLATIEYQLNPDTARFVKANYHIEGNLLISLGSAMELPIA